MRGPALAFSLLLLAPLARADSYELTSDTTTQFYDVRTPTGVTVYTRRRLTTTLGLGAYDLLPRDGAHGRAPDLFVRARLRYDADVAQQGGFADPRAVDEFVPGFAHGPFDLMYAYLEGRRFLKGCLGFRAGRQYTIDPLGFWAFDGALVRVTTPYYIAAEALSGFEVRGGLPLSSGRWETSGAWRGSRADVDPSLYPSFQPASIAPAFGGSLESIGIGPLHAKLTYRRVYNTGGSTLTQFANALDQARVYDGTRLSHERIGGTIDASLGDVIALRSGLVYDAYNAGVMQAHASADAFVTNSVTLSADYDYYRPAFDADSIWNFFGGEPMNYLGLRASVDLTKQVSVSSGAYGRLFSINEATTTTSSLPTWTAYTVAPPNTRPFDGGGQLAANYRKSTLSAGLRGSLNMGDAGHRVGGDLYADQRIATRHIVSTRLSLYNWEDTVRARGTTSLAYLLGTGYEFSPKSRVMVELDHAMNSLVGHRFRFMVSLTLAVAP